MKSICDKCSLKSLIRQPTYYKNFEKPTCRDLTLTNMPRSFQSTCVIGLSDFHLMILTVMSNFKKNKPRIVSCRSYNNFSNECYRKSLFNELKREVFCQ